MDELARALRELPELLRLLAPADTRRLADDLSRALEGDGTRAVALSAIAPQPVGITTADGIVPILFTDSQVAHEYAVTHGLIAPHETSPMLTASPASSLRGCLVPGCAGAVLDDGSDRRIQLERAAVARLYALLS
ncbi:MAG: hypothetical protein U0807_10170 [Candidatus Binatia bacterium]